MKNTKMIVIVSALVISLGMTACTGSAGNTGIGPGAKDTGMSTSALIPPTSAVAGGKKDSKSEEFYGSTAELEKNDIPAVTPAEGDIREDADYTGEGYGDEIAAEAPAYSEKSASLTAKAYSADTEEAYLTEKPAGEYEEYPVDEPVIDDPVVVMPEPQQVPEAGLLTAGEWNDNDNWGFFTNLINTQKISFPSYGVDPRFRIKVTVKDKTDAQPVVNAKVSIYGTANELLWSAVTDKNGTAYLFTDDPGVEFTGIVEYGGVKTGFTGTAGTDIQTPSEGQQGTAQTVTDEQQRTDDTNSSELELSLDSKGASYKKTDVMFIVDATGSMCDEMMFLQMEFSDIAQKVGDENTRYSVNFYRDEGDEYVTKCSDFTNDVSELQMLLNAECAEGGGDTPEAVDRILDECINSKSWSEDSVKLAFLIFDAPPHYGTERSLAASIKAAAEKGIRLIPVVGSNAERDTELFGRAIAVKTGGTYVFLTDDSGIGGSHLEPIIGKYDVEKLNELIIRVINGYKQ